MPRASDKKVVSPRGRKVCLVTGARSGLGNAVTKMLLAQGHEVRVLLKEHRTNLESFLGLPPGIIPYVGDVKLQKESDKKALDEAAKGIDYAFHLAGAVYTHKHTFDDFINTNVVGTENVLKACADGNPGKSIRFVFPSTVAIYGKKRPGEILTEESELKPFKAYNETKVMAEEVIRIFSDVNPSLKYTIFRLSTMYGPGYDDPYFFKILKYLREQRLSYIGSALNHITLVHEEDAAKIIVDSVDMPQAANKIYNISDGRDYTLKLLFDKAAAFLGVPQPKKHMPPALAALGAKVLSISPDELDFLTSDRRISIDKAETELGFSPKMNFDVEGRAMVERFLTRYRRYALVAGAHNRAR
jgi:nucleoside-diphosphate-sugar epimerase